MLDGDVLQQPTTPVMKETNMKKKVTMKRAIMDLPISATEREKFILIFSFTWIIERDKKFAFSRWRF